MVDLSRTELEMLSEIGAPCPTPSTDAPASGAPWRLVGRTPAELLPILTTTFRDRYAHVPNRHVFEDLIYLVKKALGNAYKWGNKTDPDKFLIVTSVMTATGAVIKITDQGNGFDVRHVIEHCSFTHGGSGVAHFHKTQSVISYADGGRTFLIRFLCDTEPAGTVAGMPVAATARASSTCPIAFSDLGAGDQVKVKVVREADGRLLARKVIVRPLEDAAVIEAPLQDVQDNGMVIRILDSTVRLSEQTDIVGADLGPAGRDQLTIGDIVWLTGTYNRADGLLAARIKIRSTRNGDTSGLSELQGRIEDIDHSGRSIRLLGIAVATDARTELRSSLPPSPRIESTPSLQGR